MENKNRFVFCVLCLLGTAFNFACLESGSSSGSNSSSGDDVIISGVVTTGNEASQSISNLVVDSTRAVELEDTDISTETSIETTDTALEAVYEAYQSYLNSGEKKNPVDLLKDCLNGDAQAQTALTEVVPTVGGGISVDAMAFSTAATAADVIFEAYADAGNAVPSLARPPAVKSLRPSLRGARGSA